MKKKENQLILCKQAQKYIFPKKQQEQTLNLRDQPGKFPQEFNSNFASFSP